MRFNLDENIGKRTAVLFAEHGHEVHTVTEERLQGASDDKLFGVCCAEQRCLVSLDLDFCSILRFPPSRARGIAVLRVPSNPSLELLKSLVGQLLEALMQHSIDGQLWIVEPGRIRMHDVDDEER
jgi:predicted nuclease of predicted toxin-antitoxin system